MYLLHATAANRKVLKQYTCTYILHIMYHTFQPMSVSFSNYGYMYNLYTPLRTDHNKHCDYLCTYIAILLT